MEPAPTPALRLRHSVQGCGETGVAGDLMVHLISGMQFVLGINEAPRQASAMGGIYRWKDGRNMPDVHTVLFQYGEIPVYVRLSLGCATPEMTTFMGSKGTLEYRGSSVKFSSQQGVDTAPSYYCGSFPAKMRREYEQKWHADHDPVPGKETVDEGVSYVSDDYDDLKPHLWNFFQSVRSRKPVVQDAVFGHHAALACHMANESYFRKSQVVWDEAAGEIKSMA